MAREAVIKRSTSETTVAAGINVDGTGQVDVNTGVPFFDHMLSALGRHSLIDLVIDAQGDLEVDAHHTVEDVGICIGQGLAEVIGDKAGLRRFGSAIVPMDEALVLAAVDISGRGALFYDVGVPIEIIGTFDTTLAREFFTAVAINSGVTLHLHQIDGENAHHIIEASFKAFARALRQALELDPRVDGVPSTKGSL